jgi:signal transduction histidine kinase
MDEIVSVLPPAWQYPEIAAARIRLDGTDYTSAEFASSSWKQSAEMTLADGRPLVMEVFYLTEQSPAWEGPFLAEERQLLNSLAQMLKAELDRRQAEDALKESEHRIRNLAGRLILAQEEERMRIARDLHDDVLQQVAALGLAIGKIGGQYAASAIAAEEFTDLETRAQNIGRIIRQMSHELHPAALAYTDLFSLFRSNCDEFQNSTGIQTVLHTEGSPQNLPSRLSLNLYRIAQEALRNIAKHSASPEATVSIAISPTECSLRISDRGRGFNVRDAFKSGGLGLNSIEERAHLLGGTLTIESHPGIETFVLVRAPLASGSSETGKPKGAP